MKNGIALSGMESSALQWFITRIYSRESPCDFLMLNANVVSDKIHHYKEVGTILIVCVVRTDVKRGCPLRYLAPSVVKETMRRKERERS